MGNEQLYIQCNLNLVALHSVTICNLVAILKKIMFQFAKLTALHLLSDTTYHDLVTVFWQTNSVTKSRVHCTRNFDGPLTSVQTFENRISLCNALSEYSL